MEREERNREPKAIGTAQIVWPPFTQKAVWELREQLSVTAPSVWAHAALGSLPSTKEEKENEGNFVKVCFTNLGSTFWTYTGGSAVKSTYCSYRGISFSS